MNASHSKLAAALLASVACSGCAGLQAVVEAPQSENIVRVASPEEAKFMAEWFDQLEADMKRE